MRGLARIIAVTSVFLSAFSAVELMDPDALAAQARKPAKFKEQNGSAATLAHAIELEIKKRGLNEPDKRHPFTFKENEQKEKDSNIWRVNSTARGNKVDIVIPSHLNVLHRGGYDEIISAVISAAPQFRNLWLYNLPYGEASLGSVRAVPITGLPILERSLFMRNSTPISQIKLFGLESETLLESYKSLQELIEFAMSNIGKITDKNPMETEYTINNLYGKITPNADIPPYDSKIWNSGIAFGKYIRALNGSLNGLEERRAHAASNNINNIPAGNLIILWDPKYMKNLGESLEKSRTSSVVVDNVFLSDYWVRWRNYANRNLN